MKFIIVLAVCIAGAYSAPSYTSYSPVPEIKVTSYEAPIVKVAPAYVEPAIVKVAAPSYASYAPVETKAYVHTPIEVRKPIIPIVRYNLNDDNYGTFSFDSLSGDGSNIATQGSLKNLGDLEGPVSVMHGSYSFIADDGKTYTVNWVADEEGFRATGEHLPTPPPVPVEIQESLKLSASSSYVEEAPIVRVVAPYAHSYSAPVATRVDTYEAPAIRVVASGY